MRKRILVGVAVVGVFLLGAGPRAEAQTQQSTQQTTPAIMGGHADTLGTSSGGTGFDETSAARLKHRQEMAQLSERHQHMAADADKLMQMATELKAEVDKSSKDETSVSAYNKADAIERLAHDVKQRLKN